MNKSEKHSAAWATVVIVIVCLVMAFLTGCTEEQQKTPRMTISATDPMETLPPLTPPVWGKGELPAAWSTTFGSGNNSRMNFVQSRAIDELAKRLRVLETNQYMPNYTRIDRVERWLTVHTGYGSDPNE